MRDALDYFGGAFKKPNLTMVWNRAEEQGLISYHAGCCDGRILKGLSGTGKTTLTVGKEIEQDDALVGLPIYENGKISKIKLIGLEAASFAKSEGLTPSSPEWQGLIASKKGEVVLAMNIDCEGVEYMRKEVNGHEVEIPVAKGKAGVLQCREYKKSGTTNGRFVFKFSILNKNWGAEKYLKAEGLSFRRYDIMEPMIRVTRPEMAVAFDSSCETIITSAIEGQRAGKRVRRYAATDFMAREQAEQAYLKLKAYRDLDLSLNGGLIFFVVNTGYIGAHDLEGRPTGVGEKITVDDTKKLIELVEGRKIRKWIQHPSFGYLIPHPKELEEHGVVLYVPRGVKVDLPVQACFLISKRGFEQVVHNLIIVGDEAELTINTACAAIAGETLHLGVTEMFVGRRAKLSYVMVHGWVSTSRVNPRTAAIVEEGGSLTMFYANLKPVAVIEASTTIRLRSGADASLSSVLVGKGASRIRVGGRIVLEERGARGQLVSRAIASGSSRIELPTALIATAPKVKGHIECRGLQLSRESKIVSIPLLRSLVGDVELTHEASIGRLSEEELLYLQSRGFSEDEALSLLIRGFAEVGVDKLPEALKPQVRVVLDAIARYAYG